MIVLITLARTINMMYKDISHLSAFLLSTKTATSAITDKDFFAATTVESVFAFAASFFDAARQTDSIGRQDRVLATKNTQSSLTTFFPPLINFDTILSKTIRTSRPAILRWLTTTATESFGYLIVSMGTSLC